jgi:hypothetical protein
MPELVTIPIAVVEVTVEYERPSIKLLVDRAKVVDSLFEAFRPWNIRVDDVDVITTGKPSEQGVKFKMPAKRTSFFFGAALCELVRDNADWQSAEEVIAIFNAGWNTLVQIGGVNAGSFKTAIAMHLQLKAARSIDLLMPFAPSPLLGLEAQPLKATAAVAKWENRRITVDGSAQLANGLFVKLEREFPATETLEAIAYQLKADEDQLFELLGVKEDIR